MPSHHRRVIRQSTRAARTVRNRAQFLLERLMLRGVHYRLLVIAAFIGLVAAIGGCLAFAGTNDAFDTSGQAVWWAFLRMTDTGYLGDDEGTWLRIVSTIITVLGSLLFTGALIAIMTQWLHQTILKLEQGLTPISMKHHVLILGWTNRTPEIVLGLMMTQGRVRRFLARRGARRLNIALLVEELNTALRVELQETLGRYWRESQIVMRSGKPLRLDHLRRVDFERAAAILIPGSDVVHSASLANDTRTIKTILSIAKAQTTIHQRTKPLIVAEMFDSRKIPVARAAYNGPIELVSSDAVVGRLATQNIRHRGLSYVYREILTQDGGNEIYIRTNPELTGQEIGSLAPRFPHAVVLGVVHGEGTNRTLLMNPASDYKLHENDELVLLAQDYEMCVPTAAPSPSPAIKTESIAPIVTPSPATRRILILGWNHKVPAILEELDSYPNESFTVDVLSITPTSERQRILQMYHIQNGRLLLNHYDGDYTVPGVLANFDVGTYDNIVFVASDRFKDDEDADARTVMGYLLTRERLAEVEHGPAILLELMDEDNSALIPRDKAEVLVSPHILSHILVQVALRSDLNRVFDELFGSGGAEIFIRPAHTYLDGNESATFETFQTIARLRGEIALGFRLAHHHEADSGGLVLNPPRDKSWQLGEGDEVVVLSTT